MSKPYFWAEPVRYMRWAFLEKTAITWAIVLGGTAPLIPIVAPPIRRFFGDEPGRPLIPHNYPIPKGPRKFPEGFDDPEE
ncbi:putative NADH-ubiquinone oxidoreductase 9.5 kDa subunit [Phyllosticta citricarpa]|uniref:NADH-ubiquinone oxidoreductase 9.5 kDa subunit n=2 Tax=Phyllosticta TaxID=121621 RepID=A0ABR1MLF6_9PEZI